MSANRGNKSELKTGSNHYFCLRKGWPWTIILRPLLIWRRAGWEEAAGSWCWVLARLAESRRALGGACSSPRIHKAASASLTCPLPYRTLPRYIFWHMQFEPSRTPRAGSEQPHYCQQGCVRAALCVSPGDATGVRICGRAQVRRALCKRDVSVFLYGVTCKSHLTGKRGQQATPPLHLLRQRAVSLCILTAVQCHGFS